LSPRGHLEVYLDIFSSHNLESAAVLTCSGEGCEFSLSYEHTGQPTTKKYPVQNVKSAELESTVNSQVRGLGHSIDNACHSFGHLLSLPVCDNIPCVWRQKLLPSTEAEGG
jgi:hypothetical protein